MDKMTRLIQWTSTICLILFFSTSCNSQTKEELILGKWIGVKKELKNGETGEKYTLDGKPYTNPIVIIFSDDLTGYDEYGGDEFVYKFENEFIILGNRTYVLELLTDNELVLLEYDKYDPDDEMAIRLFFEKR